MNGDLMTITKTEIYRIGISKEYKGFYYLVYAVVLALQIGARKACLNKDIYDRIAEMYSVTRESVEKCIRNCIIKAWLADGSLLTGICPEDRRKPTNGEVIAFISDRIRLERGIEFW